MKSPDYKYPSNEDLKQRIRFSAETGYIWLGEQRMLLMNSDAMGSMRRDLIEMLGIERAKGIMMRAGFKAGADDAKLAKKIRPDASLRDQFLVGPQLHQLEGVLKATLITFEFDIKKKKFYAEVRWDNSYESDLHVKSFGVSDDPVCWMEIGHASGYSTEFTGQSILFAETQCTACENEFCLIVGKPIADWENPEELTKYYEPEYLVDKILNLHEEVSTLRSSLELPMADYSKPGKCLIGESKVFMQTFSLMVKAAQGPVTVLLLGETGVGKEVFARALHRRSDRSDQPLVAVNCAAIPDDLIEAELFGVDKGAYTGAHQSRMGRFERANKGTLFLDEVGDLSHAAQAKLLRVIQEGELERVGGTSVISVDVRLIAATHTDLLEKVERGEFRKDLYYRLNIYPIIVPSLRDRLSDIPLLVEKFINHFKIKYHKEVNGVSAHAMVQLQKHQWPGNIRELENVIERGVLLCDNGGVIEFSDLFAMVGTESAEITKVDENGYLVEEGKKNFYDDFVDMFFSAQNNLYEIEEVLLKEAVNRAQGNLSRASRMLGMSRPQLAYRIGKIGDSK